MSDIVYINTAYIPKKDDNIQRIVKPKKKINVIMGKRYIKKEYK
jgi:hypothetical protein